MELIQFLQSGILQSALLINTFGIPVLMIGGLGALALFARSLIR